MFPLLHVPAQHVSIRTARPAQLLGAPLSVPHPEPTDLTNQILPRLCLHYTRVYKMRHPQGEGATMGELWAIHSGIVMDGSIYVDPQPLSLTRPGEADRVPLAQVQFSHQAMTFFKQPNIQMFICALKSELYLTFPWCLVDKTRPRHCDGSDV